MVSFSTIVLPFIFLFFNSVYSSSGYFLEISKPQQGTDVCSNECVKKVALTSNNVGTGKSCARGCRFFEIAQLIYFGNSTLNGCTTYCEESYKLSEIDLISCKTGCSVAHPRLSVEVPLIAEISWSFFIESGDLSEQDETMVEPSYKDQFANLEDFKNSELKIRSLPVKHDAVSMWKGVPHCLIASLLLLLVILALLLGLLIEESSEAIRKEDLHQAPPLPEKLPIA